MFSTKTKVILSALTALVVVGLIYVLVHQKQAFGATGQTPNCASGNTSCVTGDFYVSGTSTAAFLQALYDVLIPNKLFLGGTASSSASTLAIVTSNGTCTVSTSTLVSIQNPFGATSTLEYFSIWGTNGATTTDILGATSTGPSPATVVVTATSSLGEHGFGLNAVSTSSQFYTVIGNKYGPNGGYNNPYGTVPTGAFAYDSNSELVVGPSEYFIVFSTSTSPGKGNGQTGTGFISVPTSCTYKSIWYSQ